MTTKVAKAAIETQRGTGQTMSRSRMTRNGWAIRTAMVTGRMIGVTLGATALTIESVNNAAVVANTAATARSTGRLVRTYRHRVAANST